MTENYPTIVVVSLALLAVVGVGVAGVAAQETESPTENATAAAENETEVGANETPSTVDAPTANVTFGNQSTDGTSVTVNRTVLPEGGYVAIFTLNQSTADNVTAATEEVGLNETDDATETNETGSNATAVSSIGEVNESMLGTEVGNSTYISVGRHENVTVEYRPEFNQTSDQVLVAVAYQNLGTSQLYEGAENETIYVDEGNVVADWAYVTVDENATESTGLNETEAGLNETDAAINETETEADL